MAAGVKGPLPAFVKYAAPDAISMVSPDSARGHTEITALFGGMEGQFALLWNSCKRLCEAFDAFPNLPNLIRSQQT